MNLKSSRKKQLLCLALLVQLVFVQFGLTHPCDDHHLGDHDHGHHVVTHDHGEGLHSHEHQPHPTPEEQCLPSGLDKQKLSDIRQAVSVLALFVRTDAESASPYYVGTDPALNSVDPPLRICPRGPPCAHFV